VFNPVTDVAARQTSEEQLDLLIEPHATRVARSQRTIASEPSQVEVERTDTIQRTETNIERVANYTINLFAGPYIVQQAGRSDGGTQIGTLSAGADAASLAGVWQQLEEALRATSTPVQAPRGPMGAKHQSPQLPLDASEDDEPHPRQRRSCPTCQRDVEAAWSLCPFCETRLS
jgi:hypothetical protein